MTPNLFVATQTLFSPHKWFRNNRAERPTRKTEHWELPIPGIYEYIPGRGWYLIATDKDATVDSPTSTTSKEGGPVGRVDDKTPKEPIKVTNPVPVRYSKVLKRYLLVPDYETRKKHGRIENSRGRMIQVGFFRLDDGVAWVNCWDEEGEFIPGPYKLWCIDAKTGHFRHMLRGDDPEYQRSQANSRANSRATSRANSRANSFERDEDRRRRSRSRSRSQESRSTEYRTGPGSTRDGPSVPSTRANSVNNVTTSNSKNPSRAASRRSSPHRNQQRPAVALDAAKAALNQVAKEQAAAQQSVAKASE